MRDQAVLEGILNGEEEPKDLPLALLQDITNDFSEENIIGQGGFGEVYKGILQKWVVVAVKRIHINVDTIDDKLFRREFSSLWKTNHRNVVKFLGFCSNSYQTLIEEAGSEEIKLASVRERLLCFEYIGNGSLDKHITDELRGLEWEARYDIIMGICMALCHLKEKNIIHMDLKPANILLDDNMVPKITDFGLSRPKENSHTMGQCFGTRGYLAPEYENYGKTSVKSDIYSLGAIIIELVMGCMGVPDETNVLRRWRHRWKKPPTLLQYQQVTRCIHIAIRCREQRPEARPSILEIISLLSKSESTDVHTGQVSPCFDEDDMLGIKPLELRLPSELKEISCSIVLTNDTSNCIAFNIQLPSGQRYNAQPYKGILPPESKCVMKITVQPRDVHEHDHANEFIMQSMKVGDDLRDEDITEHMFKEASKVVDEVNLMVVYDPTKPDENGKNREDTNMPAKEVPEAKNRQIVDSAFVNGKVVSSENAEASLVRYNDIYSSTRGHCTEQIEQCEFYPSHSLSCHYPTNTTYLWKWSRAVDASRGAMGSMLDKLGKFVTEDYNLERSMKRDVESFSEDPTMIHRDLPNLENAELSLVRYKDINSSTRGHCTEQIEQCNVYPPQSFSRHYPTNTTYIGKVSRAVDATTGAMGCLLGKLGKLIKEEYNLMSMERDIESLLKELAMILKDLPNLKKFNGVKIWVDEVRELSYDIEDMVDSFMVHVKPDSSGSGFRELPHEGLLENGIVTRQQIADVIRDTKTRVKDLAHRGKNYKCISKL